MLSATANGHSICPIVLLCIKIGFGIEIAPSSADSTVLSRPARAGENVLKRQINKVGYVSNQADFALFRAPKTTGHLNLDETATSP